MDSGPLRLIEKWFSDHDDDGEFALHKRATPYSVIGPIGTGNGPVLFTTKPTAVLQAIGDAGADQNFAMVGGYGLPSFDDLAWLRTLIGARRSTFLGDMDPVDLLVFVWLRTRLQPSEIAFVGIGDAFLRALATDFGGLPQIPLAPAEQESLGVLWQVFPDVRETVGVQCADGLRDGFKLELEAALNARADCRTDLRLLLS